MMKAMVESVINTNDLRCCEREERMHCCCVFLVFGMVDVLVKEEFSDENDVV